jgi:hypothetical protein
MIYLISLFSDEETESKKYWLNFPKALFFVADSKTSNFPDLATKLIIEITQDINALVNELTNYDLWSTVTSVQLWLLHTMKKSGHFLSLGPHSLRLSWLYGHVICLGFSKYRIQVYTIHFSQGWPHVSTLLVMF